MSNLRTQYPHLKIWDKANIPNPKKYTANSRFMYSFEKIYKETNNTKPEHKTFYLITGID